MLYCNLISTPLEPNAKMCAHEGKDLAYVTMYRQLVGNMIYLNQTRPKISFAVGVMSRYMHNPRKRPMEVFQRILRYVKSKLIMVFCTRKVKNASWSDIMILTMQGSPKVQKLAMCLISEME